MQACLRCQREKVVPVALDDTMEVCGHTFEFGSAARTAPALA